MPRATWDFSEEVLTVSSTGVLPSVPNLSHVLRLQMSVSDFLTRPPERVVLFPQPRGDNDWRLSRRPGLACSVFARHYSRNHYLFSLPVGTEMFHFPTFPPLALCVQARVTRHDSGWVSPFGHPRISACLAAPRGLSQPTASFFGS